MPVRIVTIACVLFLAAANLAAQDSVMLRAGQILNCTLEEPNLSSLTARIGEPVLCDLGPLREFGRSVFPRGSYLAGRLSDYRDPGRLAGEGWLKLDFDSAHSAAIGDSHRGQTRGGAFLPGGCGWADTRQGTRNPRRPGLVLSDFLAAPDCPPAGARSETRAPGRGAADAAPHGRHRNPMRVVSELPRRIVHQAFGPMKRGATMVELPNAKLMEKASPEEIKETRKRLSTLARILEEHGVAWDYDLLVDLDLYITSLLWRKKVQ